MDGWINHNNNNRNLQCCSLRENIVALGLNSTEAVSSLLVANVTRKSLTCYEDVVRIGRVTKMLGGCNEETAAVEFSFYCLESFVRYTLRQKEKAQNLKSLKSSEFKKCEGSCLAAK